MRAEDLISPEYLESQKWLHAQPRGYGGKGDKWWAQIGHIATVEGVKTILDYGCGQGSLASKLTLESRFDVREYDPAIQGKDALPRPADMVVCTDVLEHVERDKLAAVLRHIFELTQSIAFLVIATEPTDKTLPDGRNAHITIMRAEEWKAEFARTLPNAIVEEVPRMARKPGRECVFLLVPKAL